ESLAAGKFVIRKDEIALPVVGPLGVFGLGEDRCGDAEKGGGKNDSNHHSYASEPSSRTRATPLSGQAWREFVTPVISRSSAELKIRTARLCQGRRWHISCELDGKPLSPISARKR